jgi:hypothetical protein
MRQLSVIYFKNCLQVGIVEFNVLVQLWGDLKNPVQSLPLRKFFLVADVLENILTVLTSFKTALYHVDRSKETRSSMWPNANQACLLHSETKGAMLTKEQDKCYYSNVNHPRVWFKTFLLTKTFINKSRLKAY